MDSQTATNCSGNTKPSPVVRPHGRHFQLTLNEVEKYESLKNYLTGLKNNNFFISCKEIAPTTGHEHIHIYVQFDTSVRLAISKCCGAHIEMCRGSPQQNVEYIMKEGNILDEIGSLRPVGNPTIREIKKMTKDQIEDLPWQMYNTAVKIRQEIANDLNPRDIWKDVKVIYICGDSKTGKTFKAMEYIKDEPTFNQVKYADGFWHGIGTSKVAVYDDFRDSDMKPQEFIHFIDYMKHPMNTKGGSHLNEYTTIIITSVQKPTLLYRNMSLEEPRK